MGGVSGGEGASRICSLSLVLALSQAATASAEVAVDLSPGSAATLEAPVRVGVPSLVTEIRVRNGSSEPAATRAFRASPTLVRQTDGLAVPATWKRIDQPTGDPNTIAPRSELVLQLSANLVEPGVYETWVDAENVGAAGGIEAPDHRIHVVVTRESEPVTSDFLSDPKPVRTVYWPGTGNEVRVIVGLQNTTTKPIEFLPPAVVAFNRTSGTGSDAIAAATPPKLNAGNCQSPLGPGARCALDLFLGGPLSPGQYAIDLGVAGRGGGWSQRTTQVSSRFPLGVPFLATVLGAAAGWYVQSWRTSGRRALNGLINLEALRSRARRISSGDPKFDLAAIAQPIFDDLDNAEARCRNGADISVDFDALSERVDRLSTAAAIDGAFRKLPSAAQLILARLRAAMLGQSSDRGTASDAFRKTCQALTTNMIALPDLVEGTQHAQSSGMIVAKVLALPGDGPWREALRAARDSLNSVLADAIAPLPADPPDDAAVAKRIAALAAARQSAESAAQAACEGSAEALRSQAKATLQRQGASEEERSKAQSVLNHLEGVARIVDLEERATRVADCWMELAKAGLEKTAGPQGRSGFESMEGAGPAAVPSLPGIDLPPDLWLPLSPGSLFKNLRRSRAINEYVTNAIVLLATGCAGVVLVASNDSWGSWVDVIAVFLGGLGARVVIGEVGTATNAPAAQR